MLRTCETKLTTVQKPKTIRQLCAIDTSVLQKMIARIPERSWDIADAQKENQFFCFHHTQHMIFRFIPGNQDPHSYYETPVWKLWEPVLSPIFEQAVASYQFERPIYPKAMLARLLAGHSIDMHVDGAGSNLLTHKIHIPVQTNQDVLFFSENCPFHLSEGVAYEVNNVKPHGVKNGGSRDRIHLIFEVFDAASEYKL